MYIQLIGKNHMIFDRYKLDHDFVIQYLIYKVHLISNYNFLPFLCKMTNKKRSKRSRYEEESESERESERKPIEEISDKESEDEENLEKEKGLEKKGSSKERSVVWKHFNKYIPYSTAQDTV